MDYTDYTLKTPYTIAAGDSSENTCPARLIRMIHTGTDPSFPTPGHAAAPCRIYGRVGALRVLEAGTASML